MVDHYPSKYIFNLAGNLNSNHGDVSVTMDPQGRAIVTWDYSLPKSLYCALLSSSGAVVTPTIPFHQNPFGIWTNPIGYGNTPFSPSTP